MKTGKPWIDEPLYPKKAVKLSKADQEFEDLRPGYYIFEEEESEPRICVKEGCYKKFRTRLKLLRFCSRACQEDFLRSFQLGVIKGVK